MKRRKTIKDLLAIAHLTELKITVLQNEIKELKEMIKEISDGEQE